MTTPYVFGDPLNPELSAQNVLFSLDSSGRSYIYNLWNPVTTGEDPSETTPQQVVALLSPNVQARLYGKDELERMAAALTTITPGCGYTYLAMEAAYTAATLTPSLYTITPLNSSSADMSTTLATAREAFFKVLDDIHSVAITFNPVQYLRLHVSETHGTTLPVQIESLVFCTGSPGAYEPITVDDVDAVASSEVTTPTAHTAAHAFDGSAATYWESGAAISDTPAYITVKVTNSAVLPTCVKITPASIDNAPKSFVVMGSLDADFNPYATFTKVVDAEWTSDAEQEFVINLTWWAP